VLLAWQRQALWTYPFLLKDLAMFMKSSQSFINFAQGGLCMNRSVDKIAEVKEGGESLHHLGWNMPNNGWQVNLCTKSCVSHSDTG